MEAELDFLTPELLQEAASQINLEELKPSKSRKWGAERLVRFLISTMR
jgi:hypothetical protein